MAGSRIKSKRRTNERTNERTIENEAIAAAQRRRGSKRPEQIKQYNKRVARRSDELQEA